MANKRTLRRSSDFQNIRLQGKRITASQWLSIGYLPTQLGSLRWGCTISRKVGNAVLRNRLKRWCREYFTNAEINSASVDINLVFRPSADEKFFKSLEKADVFKVLESGEYKLQKALHFHASNARK